MIGDDIIATLKKMIKEVKTEEIEKHYPNMIENMDYIWNDLVEEMERLSSKELIDNLYKMNKLVANYLCEVINKYTQYTMNINIDYHIEEMMIVGGKGGYDKENNRILISVMAIMLEAINTSCYLQTIFHEFRHQIQHQAYKESKIENIIQYPSSFLLVAKYYAYEMFHQENNRLFYQKNYNQYFPEIDANDYGIEALKNFWSAFSNPFMDIRISQDKKEKLKKIFLEEADEIKKDLEDRGKSNFHQMDIPISTIIVEKEEDGIIVVDKYLKKNPQIIEEIPILKILRNQNRWKTYEELQLEKNHLLNEWKKITESCKIISEPWNSCSWEQQINNWYRAIIVSDPILYFQDLLYHNKKEEMKRFLEIHKTFLEEYKEEDIIKKEQSKIKKLKIIS